MVFFIVRRVLQAVPILLGVTVFVFALVQLSPGDVVDILVPPEAPKEVADALRARFGLDRPVYVQYFIWLGGLLRGDLGVSIFTGQPVWTELHSALLNTLWLAIPAALVGVSLGVLLGTVAAYGRGNWVDRAVSAVAITGVSLPHYWVGIVLVAIFAASWNILPAQGMSPDGDIFSWDWLRHLILPVITLSLIPMGLVSRLVRASVLEIQGRDFVTTLRAKGLTGRRVLLHVMKNAAPSFLALIGLQLGYLIAGSVLVETVFNWPGSGNLMIIAVLRRDVPVLSGTIVLLAAIFVIINILVDVMQAVIDPRLRR
ncbi:MAG: ABC transporter permease [Rhizobiaceae bacterium]|nr:ABC transporter permease [Bdellovibrionales bacterium]MCB1467716.1 ABC transporter permease [Rhizobiaceae bacterium]